MEHWQIGNFLRILVALEPYPTRPAACDLPVPARHRPIWHKMPGSASTHCPDSYQIRSASSHYPGGSTCTSSRASQPMPDAIQRRASADIARTAHGRVMPVTAAGSATMPHQ